MTHNLLTCSIVCALEKKRRKTTLLFSNALLQTPTFHSMTLKMLPCWSDVEMPCMVGMNFSWLNWGISTIHTDQIFYAKHVSVSLYVFFTLFGCLDEGKGIGDNLVMRFSTLYSSKIEISNTNFFIPCIHNDQISYVKHVLDPLHVFFR